MEHLLIDTGSWKRLVSKLEVNPQLKQLEEWVISKGVTLFSPDTLLDEWSKHASIEKERISKSVTQLAKERNLFLIKELGADALIENAKTLLESQIPIVDRLIHGGVRIPLKTKAKAALADAVLKREAPFHKKEGSQNDAALIFSTLEYLEDNGISEVIFLSSNHNDFGDPYDPKHKLHGQITSRFPGIEVKYFSEADECFEYLVTKGNLRRTLSNPSSTNANGTEIVPIETNGSILLQLEQYFQFRNRHLNCYPLQLLGREYPFKVAQVFWTGYSNFSIRTDNQVLFDFLSAIHVNDDGSLSIDSEKSHFIEGIPDWPKKVKYVFNSLTRNLVFFVVDKEYKNQVDTRLPDTIDCECVRCQFNRFEFAKALNQLSLFNYDTGLAEQLKAAHINFRFGLFLEAHGLYQWILKSEVSSRDPELALLTRFNLVNLGVFIRSHFWGEDDQHAILQEIKQIDLEAELSKLSGSHFLSFGKWLIEKSFLNEGLVAFQRTITSIRDNFEIQTTGGYSSNQDPVALISTFAQLDSSLNENCIIFDDFSEFKDQFKIFSEGIIASHAIPPNRGTRLTYFDDYTINNLLIHGDPSALAKYIRRYNLREIHYKSSREHNTLFNILANFFSGYTEIKALLDARQGKGTSHFWDFHNRVFANLMVLGGLIKLPNDQRAELITKVVQFLTVESTVDRHRLGFVITFFQRLRQYIDRNTALTLFNLVFQMPKFHEERYFRLAASVLPNNAALSDDQRDFLMATFLDKCKVCNEAHEIETFCLFYVKLDEPGKSLMRTEITRLLEKEFSPHIFYPACLYDVVIPSKEQIESYILQSLEIIKQNSQNNSVLHTPIGFSKTANELINFCFKFRIEMNELRFESLHNLGPYYLWLSSMEFFDYSHFEVQWVTEYGTRYYFQEMRKVPKIRQLLTKYLSENKDERLANAYFMLYGVV